MKFILVSLAIILASFSSEKPKKIVFFGDSITRAAVKPGGFITLMQEALKQKGMADQYELIGEGIGGNKVYDLYLRHEEDVLAHKPDHVFIYIGVNDVWHKNTHGTGTDADKFVGFYQALIDKFIKNNISITLCTPATIGERTDFSNSQDGDLNHFSNLIRELAAKNELALIDLRKEFLAYNQKHNTENKYKGVLTGDGVHLNRKGNEMVASLMLTEIFK